MIKGSVIKKLVMEIKQSNSKTNTDAYSDASDVESEFTEPKRKKRKLNKESILKVKDSTIVCEVSDDEKEEVELSTEHLYRLQQVGKEFRDRMLEKTQNESKESINFVFANLSFVVKTKGSTEKSLINIYVKVEGDTDDEPKVYSLAYHFGNSVSEEERKEINSRFSSAKNAPIFKALSFEKYRDPKETKGDFSQVFRHSEQALYEYLKTDEFIQKVIDTLNSKDVIKLQSVVIDLYSTKSMCANCCVATYGALSPNLEGNDEFCAKLEKKIKEEYKINIINKLKKRTSFYRAARVIFDNYFYQGNSHTNHLEQQEEMSIPKINISSIDQRVVSFQANEETKQKYKTFSYKSLLKNRTLFTSGLNETNTKSFQKLLNKQRKETDNKHTK